MDELLTNDQRDAGYYPNKIRITIEYVEHGELKVLSKKWVDKKLGYQIASTIEE